MRGARAARSTCGVTSLAESRRRSRRVKLAPVSHEARDILTSLQRLKDGLASCGARGAEDGNGGDGGRVPSMDLDGAQRGDA